MNIDRRFIDLRVTIDGIVTAPVDGVSIGTQYIVASEGATGVFAGHADQLAFLTSEGWKFYTIDKIQTELFDISTGNIIRRETIAGEDKWVSHEFAKSPEVVEEAKGNLTYFVASEVLSGEERPANCDLGTVFVNTMTGMVFTGTGLNTWDSGRAITEDDLFVNIDTAELISGDENNAAVVEKPEDGTVILSKKSLTLYVYDAASDSVAYVAGGPVEVVPVQKTFTVAHKLTAEELEAKAFDLPNAVVMENGVSVSVGGVVQVPAVDFEVVESGEVSAVKWEGLGLENVPLMADDYFVITFSIEVSA